jgi:hypothetical protein
MDRLPWKRNLGEEALHGGREPFPFVRLDVRGQAIWLIERERVSMPCPSDAWITLRTQRAVKWSGSATSRAL